MFQENNYQENIAKEKLRQKIIMSEFEYLKDKLNKLMTEVYDGKVNDEILLVSQELDGILNMLNRYNYHVA